MDLTKQLQPFELTMCGIKSLMNVHIHTICT